jgi:glucose/arabinose dehydrogenase
MLKSGQKVAVNEWTFENPAIWTHKDGVLELVTPDSAYEGIRRPFSVAIAKGTSALADFHFVANVKSTISPDVIGRDVIIVFGYRSPEEFYYAHLSNDNTVMPHNGIFIVDHADRRRIDDQGLENPPEERLNDSEWHQVRIDRIATTGKITVYLDDLRSPLMTATDTTFKNGSVGFGSFDDTGAIRDVSVVSGTPPLIDPISEPIAVGDLSLRLEHFADIPASDTTGGPLARINYLGHANDNSGRLFVNDLRGKLYVIDDGEVSEYLDLRSQYPNFVDDPGLGSGFGFFAFHPDFAQNGKLYTVHTEAGEALENETPDYSNGPGDVIQGVLLEWTTSAPGAPTFSGTAREVLRLGFSAVLHGIQQIAFDPSASANDSEYGLLYVSVGDGERPGAQSENPQSLGAHTGKILRIDPLGETSPNGNYGIPTTNPFLNKPDALGEIWALGLRNPHRFSWDAVTHAMYIGHIGEAKVESIFRGQKGANYGWNHREGGFRFEKGDPFNVYPISRSSDARFTNPAARFDHDELSALVGGFVYRGNRLPALLGKYVFGDIVSGQIYYVDARDLEMGGADSKVQQATLIDSNHADRMFEYFSGRSRADLRFGMDANGEMYVLSKANGSIWSIEK